MQSDLIDTSKSGETPATFSAREAEAETRGVRGWRRLIIRPEAGGAATAVVIYLFFAALGAGGGFNSPTAVSSWLDEASQLGIIAVPVGLLMIAGEFDLSVGAVVGTTSITVAIATGYFDTSPWLGIAIAAVIGIAVGVVNGFIVVRTKLPSFIVTLATMLMLDGLALFVSNLLTGSSSISAAPSGLAQAVFAGKFGGFSTSIIWWIVVIAIASFTLQSTRFGNWIFATGGNLTTARQMGVPTARVKIALFVATSMSAVLVGTIQTLAFSNGNITLGSNYVFSAIAAAVIGGVLLTGGYGSTVGIVFGSITYGIVSLGVFYLGWNADLTQLFVGALLLLAVLMNSRLRSLAVGRH